MILDDIVNNKKAELARLRSLYKEDFLYSVVKDKIERAYPVRDFVSAIAEKGGPDNIRIIAEVKKASPSKGVLRKDFYPFEIARMYEIYKAAAVSVITEEKFFLGKLEFITPIKTYTKLPILRKDFIFDEYQVYETRGAGADAMLLIAAILDKDTLKRLMQVSSELGMSTLVEVHDEEDLEKALACDAKLIGINNRDLKTFETRLETTKRLAPMIPRDKVIIAESGINTHEDILELKSCGVSAFLVGEALMKEDNLGKKLSELRGVPFR